MIISIYFVSNIIYTYCCAVVVYAKSGFITFNSSSFDETSLPVPVPGAQQAATLFKLCKDLDSRDIMPAIFFNFSRTSPGPNRAGRFLGNRRSKNSNQICVALDTVQVGGWSSIESESKMAIFGPIVGWPKKTPWRLTMAHRHDGWESFEINHWGGLSRFEYVLIVLF